MDDLAPANNPSAAASLEWGRPAALHMPPRVGQPAGPLCGASGSGAGSQAAAVVPAAARGSTRGDPCHCNRRPKGGGCTQVLINNAGMLERCTLEDVSEDAMISSYRVNCMGPLFTVQALLKQKLLHSGALIANVTSLVRCPSPPVHCSPDTAAGAAASHDRHTCSPVTHRQAATPRHAPASARSERLAHATAPTVQLPHAVHMPSCRAAACVALAICSHSQSALPTMRRHRGTLRTHHGRFCALQHCSPLTAARRASSSPAAAESDMA